MKRVALLLAVFAALLLAPMAQAAPPGGGGGNSSFAFVPANEGQWQSSTMVEQQTDYPWPPMAEQVINPWRSTGQGDPGCYWDVDDNWWYWGNGGSLAAGASSTLTNCFVNEAASDYHARNGVYNWYSFPRKYLAVSIQTASPNLAITVCYPDRCFPTHPYLSGGYWTYESCTQVVYDKDDPILAEIPGSQGGIGVRADVTVTVRNPTNKTVKGLSVTTGPSWLQAGGGVGTKPGCAGHAADIVSTEYPYRYYVP